MASQQLESALQAIVGFEIVQKEIKSNQMRYFGRVRTERMAAWLAVVTDLLLNVEAAPWSIDVSKQYFLKGGKLFFGWRIILQGNEIEKSVPNIVKIVQSTRIPVQEVGEVRLNAKADRNDVTRRNGRGAQPMGTAVVGPMAKALGRS